MRRVVVGAHYDSIARSPGADDNGSGTVMLLELARRLAESPIEGLEVTIVLFGAEEILAGYSRNDHHYGSRQMADELMAAAVTLPDEMLSVDMVGFDDTILAASYRDLDRRQPRRLVAAGARPVPQSRCPAAATSRTMRRSPGPDPGRHDVAPLQPRLSLGGGHRSELGPHAAQPRPSSKPGSISSREFES